MALEFLLEIPARRDPFFALSPSLTTNADGFVPRRRSPLIRFDFVGAARIRAWSQRNCEEQDHGGRERASREREPRHHAPDEVRRSASAAAGEGALDAKRRRAACAASLYAGRPYAFPRSAMPALPCACAGAES